MLHNNLIEKDWGIQPQEKILNHHNSNKEQVIQEIIDAYPEESFCFLNEGKLREKVELLQTFFLPDNPYRRIAYAVKANPREEILEILGNAGIDTFDCASAKEISDVRTLYSDAKILFNHPIKRAKDIRFANEKGVLHFTVQTKAEIQKVLQNISPFKFPPPVEIAVRLQTLNSNAKVNLSTKYGAEIDEAKTMLRVIKDQHGAVPGLSIHTGSQNTDLHSFKDGISLMMDLAEKEGGIKTLNIGGGLPVNYFENDNVDTKAYLRYISRIIEEKLPKNLSEDPEIIIELGRAIIAEAVDLLIPVLAVEKRNKRKCVYFNDGVFTSFSDAVVHKWPYNFKFKGKNDRKLSLEKEKAILFGRTCDSGDVLGKINLPRDLAEGDYLHLENAGAYMDSQTTYFNGFEPPQYIIYNNQTYD